MMSQSLIQSAQPRSEIADGLLAEAEKFRESAAAAIQRSRRSQRGQFLTPGRIAAVMVAMICARRKDLRVLDPGAGSGVLSAALVAKLIRRSSPPRSINITAFEIDKGLVQHLERTLQSCGDACREVGVVFQCDIHGEDYIAARCSASSPLFRDDTDRYDCVVMNPPYRKIYSASRERFHLRAVGIETSNLYTAFMLLAARQLSRFGEFVSINPRSFCNGPYFRPFRREFFRLIALKRIHVFESRSDAFKDDEVLQENVILHGLRTSRIPQHVVVSQSLLDGSIARRQVAPEQVSRPQDPEAIIHIITDASGDELTERMLALSSSLPALGLQVSTGRVVDFRARQHLRRQPEEKAAPLIYPAHMKAGRVEWPIGDSKKPNAIAINESTANLLVPSGFYVLVKRFTAKEERRRIVASVFDPGDICCERVGFENKTNYFHCKGQGVSRELARGLAVFLNSTALDKYFRLFSGHTQVNAADLRRLPFPTHEQLIALATQATPGDNAAIDAAVDRLLS